MKKIILFTFLLASISSTIFANDVINKLSEQEIKTMLCHKWKLTFLEFKGKKKDIPANVPASFIGFLPDGTFYQLDGKQKYNGTWTYSHSTKTITTIDKDGTEKHAIVDLGNDIFVMNGKYKGFVFNMGLKKAD